jgi:hypothetical protein
MNIRFVMYIDRERTLKFQDATAGPARFHLDLDYHASGVY